MTAEKILKELKSLSTDEQAEKNQRYYKGEDKSTKILGTPFGKIFQGARTGKNLPLKEVKNLLDSPYYEARMAAVATMDFKVRGKSPGLEERKALFDLYLSNHHRIDNWDLVDRAAWRVVGNYLLDRDRTILYQLAREGDHWEKRTAIVSTYAFIRTGEVEDTFNIAKLLLDDPFELTQRAVGSWVREAGKKSPDHLLAFLDKYAAKMARISLRYAVEKLDKSQRDKYMKMQNRD